MITGPNINSLDNLRAKEVFWNACLEINLEKITSNLHLIQNHIGHNTRIMPVLKSEGYGTCNITLANHLYKLGIDIIGLAFLHEAITLRNAGIKQNIFLINITPDEVSSAINYGFEVGISRLDSLKNLKNSAKKQKKQAKVHIHINTGMCRFGCSSSEALELFKLSSNSPFVEIKGVFSHFASSSKADDDEFSRTQIKRFEAFIQKITQQGLPKPPYYHISNSSGILRFPNETFNMVRLGLSMYGIHTSSASQGILPLENALTLKAKLIHIRRCSAGDTVSYGRHFLVEKEMLIGVISLGYSDGLHLNYSQQSYVFINGQKAPYIGKICMDCFMIDLSRVPESKIGDEAIIFGEDRHGNTLSPENFARKGKSIPHELISCLGPRIFRKFI
ncbi:Alanine racemase [Chlamydiales bacterium SCGC AB-751-O23]|jgi:Alr-MurF fusion protein|nr:Alanine racemase [Chlamydiales bacterium SCGC AB-751-O23]